MTVLLEPLSREQLRLIEAIYKPFRQDGSWPVFQYVEAVLGQEDLDATSLLTTLPKIGSFQQNYGFIWYDRPSVPIHETRVTLTVAGLAQCKDADEHLGLFLYTLNLLVELYRSFIPSPTAPQKVVVNSNDLSQKLEVAGFVVLPDMTLPILDEFLQHEPATWGLSRQRHDDASWNWELHPFIRKFRGITTVEAYLTRLDELIGVPLVEAPPIAPSPLSLPLAIDFLDTTWRVWNRKDHLFARRDATTDAQLALDCATFDEFNARLSALATVLKSLNIPPVGDLYEQATEKPGPLEQLGRYLSRELPDAAGQERVARAIEDLKCINRIRTGGQHGGKKPTAQAARAFHELGIGFPPTDWGSAWDTIRARAVEALGAVREEIQAVTSDT